MPPRYAYWTIILDGKPTAFRAHTSDELLPTFRQLQTKHPDATMVWFARGRLWASPEEERAAARARQERPKRDSTWRPGGEHRDPRERFKIPRDEKRRRFAGRKRREEEEERGPSRGPGGASRGPGGGASRGRRGPGGGRSGSGGGRRGGGSGR